MSHSTDRRPAFSREHGAIEIVIGKFKAGVTMERQLDALAKISQIASRLDGFVERHYFYSDAAQQWVDFIVWQNAAMAQQASQQIGEDPEALAIFELLDESATALSHYTRMGGSEDIAA